MCVFVCTFVCEFSHVAFLLAVIASIDRDGTRRVYAYGPRLIVALKANLGDSQRHKYVMDLGEGSVIDASRKGTILRFVNHSCGPNAETQKWTIQGRRRIGLFAKDDIAPGEEVSEFARKTGSRLADRDGPHTRTISCGEPKCERRRRVGRLPNGWSCR